MLLSLMRIETDKWTKNQGYAHKWRWLWIGLCLVTVSVLVFACAKTDDEKKRDSGKFYEVAKESSKSKDELTRERQEEEQRRMERLRQQESKPQLDEAVNKKKESKPQLDKAVYKKKESKAQLGEAVYKKKLTRERESVQKTPTLGEAGENHKESIYEDPVYNILFDPTLSRDPLVLKERVKTNITFYIGPTDDKSVLTDESSSISPDLNQQLLKDSIPLSVTMVCLVCSQDSVQTQQIKWYSDKGCSDRAKFQIVPTIEAIKQNDVPGHITFNVSGQGVEYDHIVLAVKVSKTASIESSEERVIRREGSRPPDEPRQDVVLTIFSGGPDGRIGVQVNPTNPQLAETFGGLHLTPDDKSDDKLRTFTTGLKDQDSIQEITTQLYTQIVSLIDEDPKLKSALQGTSYTQEISDKSYIRFDLEDKKKVLETFHKEGSRLYRKLFCESEDGPVLSKLIMQIEDFRRDDIPLRLVIETKGVQAPWQFLHRPGPEISEHAFWGFRFELAVRPIDAYRQGRFAGQMMIPKPEDILFGVYRPLQAKTEEEAKLEKYVERLGKTQAAHLESKLNQDTPIAVVNSRKAFLTGVNNKRKQLKLLFAFTHAASGTAYFYSTSGSLLHGQEVAGPRLMFAIQDYVRPGDIDELKSHLPLNEQFPLFFSQEPIVLLNACETSTTGAFPIYELSFVKVFLDLGARGVIVTEGPILNYFALNFGNLLIDQLFNGVPIAKAMRNVRMTYLEKTQNPFGLLYSYFGNPVATLSANN